MRRRKMKRYQQLSCHVESQMMLLSANRWRIIKSEQGGEKKFVTRQKEDGGKHIRYHSTEFIDEEKKHT